MAKNDKAHERGVLKLKSSGIDPRYPKDLGLTFLSGEKTHKLHKSFKPLCSIKIDYFDHEGKPLSDWPSGDPFYRVRYLEQPTGFDGLTEKKPVKYMQEPETLPCAYYPLNQEWTEIVVDVTRPLIITEGELKAIKACQETFPTIGLGGVYAWKSPKHGYTWLPSLDPIKWGRRYTYLCFDSDFRTNPMVCSALQELAEQLYRRGAFVNIVALPKLSNEEKTGLDDFLKHPEGGKEAFEHILKMSEPLGLARTMFDFNKRYVYVRNPGMVIEHSNENDVNKSNPSGFKEHLESTAEYIERSLKKDGSISYDAVPAATAWLKWPLRLEVDKMTYNPGAEKFFESEGNNVFNIWRGWGCLPKKGTVKPFIKLIDYLFTGAEPTAKEWFLKWCAFPLQYPGTKLASSVVFHGVEQGTGKSLIGYTLGKIYGKNFTELNSMELHANFNEWAEGKQFVMGDDVTGSDKRGDANLFKKMITQKEIRINTKYVAGYIVPDCINYFFTANHADAFFLEDKDRRFFVHEVMVPPLPTEFYKEYDLWKDGTGPSALFDYLKSIDVSDFDPAGHAFKTAAKERMIANTQTDLSSWIRAITINPDDYLKVGDIPIKKDLFTAKELLLLYDPLERGPIKAQTMGRELSNTGVPQVFKGQPFKAAGQPPSRYYILRNRAKWVATTGSVECVKHLDACAKAQTPQKKY